jgi:hypothetical protein
MKNLRFVFSYAVLLSALILSGSFSAHTQTGCTVNVSANSSAQSAIDNANSGAVLCLSPGTHRVSLVVSKNLTLRGAGKDTQGQWRTVLRGAERGKPVVRIDGSQSIQVTIDSVAITNAKAMSDFPFCAQLGPAICPYGVHLTGRARALIQNSRVAENEFSGVFVEESAQVEIRDSSVEANLDIEMGGVVVRDDGQLTLIRSKISGNGIRGVMLAERAKGLISQAQIEEHFNDGIFLRDTAQLELRDALVQDNDACGLRSASSGSVRGSNNKFSGNGLGALCGAVPASLRAPLVPQGTKTRVSVPQDYSLIQEAIDAVAPGGTIAIGAGQYEGGLTIYKNLTLQGASASQVQIKGGISVCCEVKKAHLEKFKAQEALTRAMLVSGASIQLTLSNVTLTGAEEGGLETSGSVRLDLTDSVIQGMKGSSAEALRAGEGSQVTLNNAQMVYNEGLGILVLGGQVILTNSQIAENQKHGLKLRAGVAVLNNSRILHNGENGLEVEGTVTLSDSQILGNKRNGIRLVNGTVIASNNTRIADSGAHGLEAEGGQLTMAGVEISANKELGLSLSGASVSKLENTRVLNNRQQGLLLDDVARLEIKMSTIQGNGADGIQLASQSSATIVNNKILNNSGWGVVATLKRCGFDDDRFRGKASTADNEVSGNKLGDICLP